MASGPCAAAGAVAREECSEDTVRRRDWRRTRDADRLSHRSLSRNDRLNEPEASTVGSCRGLSFFRGADYPGAEALGIACSEAPPLGTLLEITTVALYRLSSVPWALVGTSLTVGPSRRPVGGYCRRVGSKIQSAVKEGGGGSRTPLPGVRVVAFGRAIRS